MLLIFYLYTPWAHWTGSKVFHREPSVASSFQRCDTCAHWQSSLGLRYDKTFIIISSGKQSIPFSSVSFSCSSQTSFSQTSPKNTKLACGQWQVISTKSSIHPSKNGTAMKKNSGTTVLFLQKQYSFCSITFQEYYHKYWGFIFLFLFIVPNFVIIQTTNFELVSKICGFYCLIWFKHILLSKNNWNGHKLCQLRIVLSIIH